MMMFIWRWVTYWYVDLFEFDDIVVRVHESGILLSGAALGESTSVTVKAEKFDAFTRELAKHAPDESYTLTNGSREVSIAPRFLRRLRQEAEKSISVYRMLRPGKK